MKRGLNYTERLIDDLHFRSQYRSQHGVSDPGVVDPDPTQQRKSDPDPADKKKPDSVLE